MGSRIKVVPPTKELENDHIAFGSYPKMRTETFGRKWWHGRETGHSAIWG